jgi:uncharacterized cupredoxin-like copper-binding protein
MRAGRNVVLVALTGVLAAAGLAGAGLAGDRPAAAGAPPFFESVYVKLGDKTLTLSRYSTSGVQVVIFDIRNVGTVKHNFIVGTHATREIAPGQTDTLAVPFDDFGRHTYRCTLHCPSTSHGVITVERGDFTG